MATTSAKKAQGSSGCLFVCLLCFGGQLKDCTHVGVCMETRGSPRLMLPIGASAWNLLFGGG